MFQKKARQIFRKTNISYPPDTDFVKLEPSNDIIL